MVKQKMTIEEYDSLCDRIRNNPSKCRDWWPEVEDLKKYVLKKPMEYIEFLIWILETADTPKTEKEKFCQKALNKIIIKTLEIV